MNSIWKRTACILAALSLAGCNCKSPTAASTIPLSAGVLKVQVSGKSSLVVGETTKLLATATFEDGTSKDVTGASTWLTDASAVCQVAAEGNLLGAAIGSCSVSAVYTNVSGQLGVDILGTPNTQPNPGTPSVPSNPNTPTLLSLAVQGTTAMRVGDSAPWQAIANMSDGSQKTVTQQTTWASLNPSVASVGNAGLVSAASVGSATIQAFYQGESAGAIVTVSAGGSVIPTVLSITVTGTPTVGVGQTTQLQAVANFSDGSTQAVTALATWNSASTSRATVVGGLVTGVSAGASNVSAAYSGKSGALTVTVTAAPAQKQLIGIQVDATVDLTQVSLGQLVQLHVFGVYSDGSKTDVTSSAVINSDDPLLRIDGPGLLNVLLTLTSALLDPTHVVNVQYGGFTEAINITIKTPVIQSLQLGSGGVLSTSVNSQLPALQALFSGNQPATLSADFPGWRGM